MKVNANTLRPGNVVDKDNRLWVVEKYELITPGKGNAVMQIVMRDIRNGSKDHVRYRTQETVERVRLDQDDYQFLYMDGEEFTFMHLTSYEQINVKRDVIGYPAVFLQEGMQALIETFEGEALNVQIPDFITSAVVEAEPVIKGQTATTSYKPAIIENGERVMVPPHINTGTRIVVKTEDGSYVERAKD